MRKLFKSINKVASLLVMAGLVLTAQTSVAQPAQSVDTMRASYNALLDGFDQVFRQEGNARGLRSVLQARSAMSKLQDLEIATLFPKSTVPDLTSAIEAIQRLAARSQENLQSNEALKSAGFPNSPPIVPGCNSVSYDAQSVFDALYAFQVTSKILAAAAYGCVETVLGENLAGACIPLAIANDIASSIFAVRSFCKTADTGALVAGSYDRLGHIHTDLTNTRADIINTDNTNTATLTRNINTSTTGINTHITSSTAAINTNVTNSTVAINTNVTNSKTAIIRNDNTNTATVLAALAADTTKIVDTSNSNTTAIITNANANRDMIVGQLQALGCEIVRLLNTPNGKRESSVAACAAQPGFPYSWNTK